MCPQNLALRNTTQTKKPNKINHSRAPQPPLHARRPQTRVRARASKCSRCSRLRGRVDQAVSRMASTVAVRRRKRILRRSAGTCWLCGRTIERGGMATPDFEHTYFCLKWENWICRASRSKGARSVAQNLSITIIAKVSSPSGSLPLALGSAPVRLRQRHQAVFVLDLN